MGSYVICILVGVIKLKDVSWCVLSTAVAEVG